MNQLYKINVNVTPVRVAPDAGAEQDTQYILGQSVQEIERAGDWVLVRCHEDSTQGWVRKVALTETDLDCGRKERSQFVVNGLIVDLLQGPEESSQIVTKLTLGTLVTSEEQRGSYRSIMLPNRSVGWLESRSLSAVSAADMHFCGEAAVAQAKRLIGVPYLWGGTTPFGIDCSGFVRLIYRLQQVHLPRNSQQQCDNSQMAEIGFSEVKAGDLVFFGRSKEEIGHVGLIMDVARFIHSCGPRGVCISCIDEHRYASIRISAKRLVSV